MADPVAETVMDEAPLPAAYFQVAVEDELEATSGATPDQSAAASTRTSVDDGLDDSLDSAKSSLAVPGEGSAKPESLFDRERMRTIGGKGKLKRNRSTLKTVASIVSNSDYFKVLCANNGTEEDLYAAMSGSWELLGVVGAFLAALSHIGFVQFPSWFPGHDSSSAWVKAYALSLNLAVVSNLGAVFISAFLLLFLAFVPKGSVQFSLKKMKYLIFAPAYWCLIGMLALLLGLVFLARISYSDVQSVWYVAGVGFVLTTLLLVGSLVYMTVKSQSAVAAAESGRQAIVTKGIITRALIGVLSLVSYPKQYLLMVNSGLEDAHMRDRLSSLWSTVAVTSSIIGTASFEGLWLRSAFYDKALSDDASYDLDARIRSSDASLARGSATCMYLGLFFSAMSLLLAISLSLRSLFAGPLLVKTLIRDLPHALALPAVFAGMGIMCFLAGVPFVFAVTYSHDAGMWLSVVVFAFAGIVGLVVVPLLWTRCRSIRTENVSTMSKPGTVVQFLTLHRWYIEMINSMNESEALLYQRVARCWSTTAMVGALLTMLSFLSVQVFGEYKPREEGSLSIHLAASAVALVCNVTAVIVALFMLVVMSSMPKGRLSEWLTQRASLILLPASLLAVGVGGLLVAIPTAAYHVYPRAVFYCALALAIAALLMMVSVRLLCVHNVPNTPNADDLQENKMLHAQTRIKQAQKRSLLDWLCRSDLFMAIASADHEESVLFSRFAVLLDNISLMAALLCLLSMDSFRELPVEASLGTSKVYGMASLCSLFFNLTALFLGTFYGLILSVVPSGSAATFIHKMQHFLFLPVLSLLGGFVASLVSWTYQADIQFSAVPGAVWSARGICIGGFVAVTFIYLFLANTSKDMSKLAKTTAARQRSPGCLGLLRWKLTAWQRSLTETGLTGDELHTRMEAVWSSLGVMGSLMAAVSFLAFQQGLQLSNQGAGPEGDTVQLFFVVTVVLSLVFNALGALVTMLMNVHMNFVSTNCVRNLLRNWTPVLLVPNAFLFVGSMCFLSSLPFVGRTLYGDQVFIGCAVMAWGLGGLSFLVTVAMQTCRGWFTKKFYQNLGSDDEDIEAGPAAGQPEGSAQE
eukprot:m.135404 g.135404  ORF g.135404 m.135404 type:complete len:1088 (-) comp16950_c0_seq1:35-3298(-)